MTPEELIKFVQTNKRRGIVKEVANRTGISIPTVMKYLSVDNVYNQTALKVIKAAKEVIDDTL